MPMSTSTPYCCCEQLLAGWIQGMFLTSPGPSTPLPHHFLVVCSPHNPPYEQLLIGMGVGAMALGIIVWPWWWWWWWWWW